MKLLILLFAVWNLAAKTTTRQLFKCNTPEEWFTGNGTGINSFWPGAKWPEGIVKYELDSSLSSADRQEVQKAFNDIQSKTCIRFQQRALGEAGYTRIQTDDNVCGLGDYCYKPGKAIFAKFGRHCRHWNMMVHELGHNLCMGHEHTRKDRDNFIHFNGCGSDTPAKSENFDLRGSLYDYASQMHYSCGWCGGGGWPKEVGAAGCGPDIQQGLSVLDADKINDFYDCGGCRYGHRWRPIDALTDADRRSMIQFGQSDTGQPYYICRGNIGGQIAIGKFVESSRICYVPYHGSEHQLRTNAQVYTWPSRTLVNGKDESQPSYKVVNSTELGLMMANNPIPSGRTAAGVTGYAAIADIEYNGRRDRSIGGVFENDWSKAYIPGWGREFVVSSYSLVTCG